MISMERETLSGQNLKAGKYRKTLLDHPQMGHHLFVRFAKWKGTRCNLESRG